MQIFRIKTIHTSSNTNLWQKHKNMNLQKSFDSSLWRRKNGLILHI